MGSLDGQETSEDGGGRWPGRRYGNTGMGPACRIWILLLGGEHAPVPGTVTALYIRCFQTPLGSKVCPPQPRQEAVHRAVRSPEPESLLCLPPAVWPGLKPSRLRASILICEARSGLSAGSWQRSARGRCGEARAVLTPHTGNEWPEEGAVLTSSQIDPQKQEARAGGRSGGGAGAGTEDKSLCARLEDRRQGERAQGGPV